MRSALISLHQVLDELKDYNIVVHNHRHHSSTMGEDGFYGVVSKFPEGIYEASISVLLPRDGEKAGDMKNQFSRDWYGMEGQVLADGELHDDLITETGIEASIFRSTKVPVTVKHHTVVDAASYTPTADDDISFEPNDCRQQTESGSVLVRTDYLSANLNFLMPETLSLSVGQNQEPDIPFLGYRAVNE